jgi:hypothetical protein
MVFVFKIKYFLVLSYGRTICLCNHPVRCSSIGHRFLILIAITFTFTLTHSDESNHNDPHDNQSPISFNLFVMLTRDMSSPKILKRDRQSTSNFNLLSGFQKVYNFRRKQLLSSFVSRQGRLFIHRSASRPLNRRVAPHPERRPCPFLFRSLSRIPLVKCQRARNRRPTQPSRAAKRSRYIPWTAAQGPWQQSPELIQIEPHAAATQGIDRRAQAAMAILVHCIGTAAIGRWTRNWQRSDAEGRRQ